MATVPAGRCVGWAARLSDSHKREKTRRSARWRGHLDGRRTLLLFLGLAGLCLRLFFLFLSCSATVKLGTALRALSAANLAKAPSDTLSRVSVGAHKGVSAGWRLSDTKCAPGLTIASALLGIASTFRWRVLGVDLVVGRSSVCLPSAADDHAALCQRLAASP